MKFAIGLFVFLLTLSSVSFGQSIHIDETDRLKIVFVGDIMLDRKISRVMTEKGKDYLFSGMSEFFETCDLVAANLESPLSKQKRTEDILKFGVDPSLAKVLGENNIKLVSLANNHILDITPQGFKEMKKRLSEHGIGYVGADLDIAWEPNIINIKGLKVAFLSYVEEELLPWFYEKDNIKVATMNINKMQYMVGNVRNKSDYVVVMMHSGKEYNKVVSKCQKNFARAAIDAGADLVIGHHSHTIQKVEVYKGRPIFYSLGNFIFDQTKKETKYGLVVCLRISKGRDLKISADIIKQNEYKPVIVMDRKEKEKVAKGLKCKLDKLFVLNYKNNKYEVKEEMLVKNNTEGKDKIGDLQVFKKGIKVLVCKGDKIIWESKKHWKIKKMIIGDVNNDGRKDINMLLEKRQKGRLTHHLFIYGLKNEDIKAKWCSSPFDYNIEDIEVADMDANGKNEFFAIENRGRKGLKLSAWIWWEWALRHIIDIQL